MTFAPADSRDERVHRRQIAAAANAALRAETHNTGCFTLQASQDYYELRDPRLGAEKTVLLCPRDRRAAALDWWMEPEIAAGRCRLGFSPAPTDDCSFNYAIFGTKLFNA